MKTVYILIGPKGSGKSYIGRILEREIGIRFLLVEPFFMKVKGDRDDIDERYFSDAWALVEHEIRQHMKIKDTIMIESLGTFGSFKDFLHRLQHDFEVKLVQIRAPPELCLSRIEKRSKEDHLAMTKKLVKHLNSLAVAEKYDFDIIIDNTKNGDADSVARFKSIL